MFGEILAPGLKEKSGSAGELCNLASLLLLAPKVCWPGRSMADLGRRPADRDVIGLGADMEAVAGKTNGGLGGGPGFRGDNSGVSNSSFGSSRFRLGPSESERWRGLWIRPSRGMSGIMVAAIFPRAAPRPERR